MAVVAYLRCSPRGSSGSGQSRSGLDAQRAEIVSWLSWRSGEVLKSVHKEVVSSVAELAERPALLSALRSLEPGDVLLVAERSRLARSVPLVCAIEQTVAASGARVEAVRCVQGEGPEATFAKRIHDAAAEYERELIRLRTSLSVDARRAAGRPVGRPPIGWRVGPDDMLERDPTEQKARRLVRYWRSRWAWSWRRCARELSRRGLPSRSGGAWHPETLRRLLRGA